MALKAVTKYLGGKSGQMRLTIELLRILTSFSQMKQGEWNPTSYRVKLSVVGDMNCKVQINFCEPKYIARLY